jgi:PAS domain S-box-containing protein
MIAMLREIKQTALWQATLDSLAAHVAVLDDTGKIIAVNAPWRRFAEAEGSGEDWIGADYIRVCERSDDPVAVQAATGLSEMLAGERDYLELEYPCHSATDQRWFLLRATRNEGSGPARLVLSHEAITPLRVAQAAASLQAALLDEIDAAVILTDQHRTVLSWNLGAEQLYGWTSEEAVGEWLPSLISPDGQEQLPLPATGEEEGRLRAECQLRRRDGSTFPAHIRTSVINRPDSAPLFVGVSIDISERKATDQALLRARNYLRAVTDNMGDGLCTLDADGRVMYMNQVAQELLGWSLEELQGEALHEVMHAGLFADAESPMRSASIAHACRGREVMRVADDVFVCRGGRPLPVAYTAAPFETEEGTEGCVIVFQDMTARKAEADRIKRDLEKLIWVNRVQEALRHEWFVLHGQPIIDVSTGAVVQCELLIRMQRPDQDGTPGELISPGRFLPIAEEYGFITEIDRWVVDRAAEMAAGGMAVELNVSARSISDPLFSEHVRSALTRTGANPQALVFEITETALIGDEQSARKFAEELHGLGCGVALDDFGTGYGGFTYLKHLPIDSLKIDIEFVRDLSHNEASHRVVEAVVGLARGFGLKTVAEGVEDKETLEVLRRLGVDYAQGYHIGRPAPLDPPAERAGG